MFAVKQITVDVPDCPQLPPLMDGIPTWVVGCGMAALFIIVIALTVAIAVVRYGHNEELTIRQRNRDTALVEAAKLVKRCPGCGMDYSIEDKLKATKVSR